MTDMPQRWPLLLVRALLSNQLSYSKARVLR